MKIRRASDGSRLPASSRRSLREFVKSSARRATVAGERSAPTLRLRPRGPRWRRGARRCGAGALDVHVDVDVEGLGDVGGGSEVGDGAFAGEDPGDDGPLHAETACDLNLGHLLGLVDVLQLLEELRGGDELRKVVEGRALLVGGVGESAAANARTGLHPCTAGFVTQRTDHRSRNADRAIIYEVAGHHPVDVGASASLDRQSPRDLAAQN